jgi:iron complex outermembrane recepter protein
MAGAHPPLSSGYQSISSKFAFWGCQPLRSLSKRLTGTGIQTAARTLLFLLTLAACQFGVAQVTVSGVVRDSSGAAVISAEVALRAGPTSATVKTGPEGRFSFSGVAESSGVIRVTAPGFASAEQAWSATTAIIELELTLQPASVSERIIVSATRTEMKLSDVPGGAVQLSTEDIAANPAQNIDDILRQVPGFSLFRRSSSRVANPTSQGVSLRGVGASGPSRALVLFDGVPFVDPFGGWVYWDRMPRAELGSVEVVRGGASSLYGSNALAGVVQFLSRVPERSSLSADISYGTENTPDLSLWAGTAISRWDMSAAVDMSRSNGYILVPASQRGLVDTEANSKHATIDAALGYRISGSGRAFLRGSFFEESRSNGTRLQVNSTGTGFGVAGINTGIGAHDWISARVFGQAQGYDQSFSAIIPDRSIEHLTNLQHVPSQEVGGGAQWNHLLHNHTLIFGADSQEIMGASDERLFSTTSGNQFATNIAGGRQRAGGIFGQDIFRIASNWTIIAGLRWDDWSNFDAGNVRIAVPSGALSGLPFVDRSATAFSPRISILRALGANRSISVSGYRAFRAPTLNELYRSFRLGPITTESNAFLKAERSTGAEASFRQDAFGRKLEARGTVFWTDIVNPVTNVTLDPVTRQRQNLGRTRSIGTEFDVSLRPTSTLQFSGGYQYTHATVVHSVAALVGLNVPEVPRHSLSWEARYWNPAKLMLSVQGRYSSLQYDDDLNTLPLGQYFVLDFFAGRELHRGITAYVAAENLLNQRYDVTLSPPAISGARPLENLGPPILARIGIRIQLPSR